jgi:CRP-like cAMP-binding protein
MKKDVTKKDTTENMVSDELLAGMRLFSGFSKSEIAALNLVSPPKLRTVIEDEVLIDDGDVQDTFFFLTSGKLRGERYHFDETPELVELFLEGDMIGLDVACSGARTSPFRISSTKIAEIVEFDSNLLFGNILPINVQMKLIKNLTRILADENIKKQYKIDVLYKKTIRGRILVFLRNVSSKRKSTAFEVNMDREQLAQYIGVNRSSLSHELSLMREDGLINFWKGRFEILVDPVSVTVVDKRKRKREEKVEKTEEKQQK